MKKYISLVVTALFATVAVAIAGPDSDAVLAKEKAAWQAFKDKKPDDFKKVVHADFRGVYADGVSDMAKEAADMKKWDMTSFEISDFKMTAIGIDVVITTYKVALQGSYDGKDASGNYNAGSVWKLGKGEGWMGIFHTNIKEMAATK